MNTRLALFILLFRWWNALWVQTFFQPDEFYQALEIAHNFVYGTGFVSWEWREGIRSAAHPLLFALVYKCLNLLHLDTVNSIFVAAPKLVQGTFAAITDVATFEFAKVRFGRRAAVWALVCSLLSFFNAYVSVRTFSSSLETTLTVLMFWQWELWQKAMKSRSTENVKIRHLLLFSLFFLLGFIIRPTNALFAIPIGLEWLYRLKKFSFRTFFPSTLSIVACLVLVTGLFLLNVYLDTWFYSRNIVPLISFLKFNVASGKSAIYGINTWHYYLTQGLPLICGFMLPFVLLGMTGRDYVRVLSILAPFSLLAHKEVRFVYPLSPILLSAAGYCISRCISRIRRQKIALVIFLLHSFIAFFLCRVHQAGVIEVMPTLKQLADANTTGVLLMPCHSTPWQSHLHSTLAETNWRFLTCEPSEYPSGEDIRFYEDMSAYLDAWENWPDYLVIFEERRPALEAYFAAHNLAYTQRARFFNSYIHDDSRRTGDVTVLRALRNNVNSVNN
ncbi:pig-B [Schizosaccharomyces japonicus yFS275]|uniref:Mannosyltransferase n=1 Tax=Schizosaccharomyces japonicus (strain yFS275 / FY16936) TaxID=402676 RepID=B6K695_SCHJY|nr:pig-B [Schizosaccharomyces japonicus yFS275]EEB09050.1 pig-B [Schizosaccharomyces japonicus yFS275]